MTPDEPIPASTPPMERDSIAAGAMPEPASVPSFARATGLRLDAPARIDAPDTAHWDAAADLVIVGLGGAGVAAALEGVERGLSVIAVDRFSHGGSTAANGGVFYAGAGTVVQREAGIDDSPAAMTAYLDMEAGEVVSRKTIEEFVAESPATIDWLIAQGVHFSATYWPQKSSYPPLDKFLYHSDNTLVARYSQRARPAPRGHRVFARNGKKAWGLGGALTGKLEAAALAKGLDSIPHAQVTRLLTDANGRVIGVEGRRIPPDSVVSRRYAKAVARAGKWLSALPPSFPLAGFTQALGMRAFKRAEALMTRHATPFRIRAHAGVLISTGGFIMNRKMLAHFAPGFLSCLPNAAIGEDGAGILLGASVGGDTALMDRISAWRFINPPKAWSASMLVNSAGRRFTDETLYGATLGDAVAAQPGGKAWVIYDADARRDAFRQARDKTIVPFQRDLTLLNLWFNKVKASTIEELAQKLAMPPAALVRTVGDYNAACAAGSDDPFGKQRKDMRPVSRGPFYAMDASIDSKMLVLATMTVGGLRVDEATGRVLDRDSCPIEGLYAAGRSAIGICSQTYVSGLSFADCIFSGRRAARDAAAQRLRRPQRPPVEAVRA